MSNLLAIATSYDKPITLGISAVTLLIAAILAVKAPREYKLQNATKRSEIFLQMRTRLRTDQSFASICDKLEVDAEELAAIPLIERDRFVGFFEELAILNNTGLISNALALYMFGYFAIKCYESKAFWKGLNRHQPLWSLFMDFAKRMSEEQKRFKFDRRKLRL